MSCVPPRRSWASASITGTFSLCTGPTCCTPEAALAAWEVLKKELKDANLGGICQRTKVGCLRICCHGPTMVVYPEGTWYRGMSADRMPRFVQEHLLANRPVGEWVFAENPVCATDRPSSPMSALTGPAHHLQGGRHV